MIVFDVLFYLYVAGSVVAVATRLKPHWFVRSRSGRVLALGLLVVAAVWARATTIVAVLGASFYGWGDPEIIWPTIALLALLDVWVARQTVRFYAYVSPMRPISR